MLMALCLCNDALLTMLNIEPTYFDFLVMALNVSACICCYINNVFSFDSNKWFVDLIYAESTMSVLKKVLRSGLICRDPSSILLLFFSVKIQDQS